MATWEESRYANGKRSESKLVTCGVPQGSVLGPLLFIIYINDVVNCIKNASIFLYADDLAIIVSGRDAKIIAALMQDDLNNIGDWCYSNMLTVNVKKTQILWCYSIRNPVDLSGCSLRLCSEVLKVVSQFNYLGVVIDTDLTFKSHCNKVKSMSFSRYIQLCKIKKNIDENTALDIYKTMILPVFDYCDYVVESGPVTAVRRLQTTQNKCFNTGL